MSAGAKMNARESARANKNANASDDAPPPDRSKQNSPPQPERQIWQHARQRLNKTWCGSVGSPSPVRLSRANPAGLRPFVADDKVKSWQGNAGYPALPRAAGDTRWSLAHIRA
jgi:hypothetical protein